MAAEKVHAYLMTYPGATGLVLRKTKTSMHNSTIAFLKKEVMGKMLSTGRIIHNGTYSRFEYWNGSVLAYGGMNDDKQKEAIRSIGQRGGVDICWMEEATQFDSADFGEVLARMRGNAASWRQIILTTNPHNRTHWIYQYFLEEGRSERDDNVRVFFSHAVDNPANPADYQSKLNRLTGVERDRLRDGKWVEAGGTIFDRWRETPGPDGQPNVTVDAEYIPDGGNVMWWVDDGYTGEIDEETGFFKPKSHPRVFLFVQQRSDGTLAIFDESYEIKMLAPKHIDQMIARSISRGYPRPSRVVYDKAAASLGGYLREQLSSTWGVSSSQVVFNNVPVDEGNKEVNTWVSPDENGVRRIIAHPRCRFLKAEMSSYSADPRTGRPIKDFDHGPDCVRIGLWDLMHGEAGVVDVSAGFDVDLSHLKPNSEGIMIEEDGDVSIAMVVDIELAII